MKRATAEPVSLCVIGAGAIAERHMEAYAKLGGVAPRWVVSLPEDAAHAFARRWSFANAGTSVAPALADADVELVLIASPSTFHSEHAVLAMQAGKDVIAEIPVAMSWSDAQRVAEVAAGLGRRVWVCHTLRSTPALAEVRRRVQSGQLHVTHITGWFGIPRRRNQGMGGIGTRTWIDNLLWHHACHQIDASLWVLGMPAVTRVHSLLGPAHPTFGMALDVGVQFVTAGGQLVTHSLSYNVEQPIWQLQFIGHEDVLTFRDGRLTDEAGRKLVSEMPTSDLTAQNRELLNAFRTREESEYELSTVLPTMEVLGRAQACAENHD